MPNVVVCIKRVPGSSGQILLSADAMSVDARHVGHTVSSHEEVAIEAAVQLIEEHHGSACVLTLGPDAAIEQLRDALAVGITSAVHLRTGDDGEAGSFQSYGPADVAGAIASVITGRADGETPTDLVLLGNDAADTGDFQVGVRLGYLLGWPVLTGIRSMALADGVLTAIGDGTEGTEEYQVPLPAVVTMKEGDIAPRYPSIPGRLKAKKAPVEVIEAAEPTQGTARRRLVLPPEQPSSTVILGNGKDIAADAAAVREILTQIGVLSR